MKIIVTEKNGETVVTDNPSKETCDMIYEKMKRGFFLALEAEMARVREGISKLKPGKKRIFLTKPVRIEISK